MFRQAALAAAAATALYAGSATAATTISITPNPDPCTGTVCSFRIDGVTTDTTFMGSATFQLPDLGTTAGALTNIRVDSATNIDFTSISLTDPNSVETFFTLTRAGDLDLGTIRLNTIPGTYTLTVRGTSGGNASFGGNLSFAAVPEPATWALFILGFGAVGHTMRRRSSKVRVAKASLNFA